jgi:hypothetical protein
VHFLKLHAEAMQSALFFAFSPCTVPASVILQPCKVT